MSDAAFSTLPIDPVLLGTPITISNRVEIFPQTPLPEFNSPGGPAYAARLKGESRSGMFAIICSEGLPVRGDILSALISKQHQNLIRFRDSGIAEWPAGTMAGALAVRRFCLVFERPVGHSLGPIYAPGAAPQPPIDIEKLITLLIRPLSEMVNSLSESGIGHGSLWPGNLFLGPNGGVQAGDCASFPPSYNVPSMFLTIERAQAHPAARGMATLTDDLYAIGVTALVMTLGFNPIVHLSDEDLMRQRIERGTFATLLGERSLKGMAPELFRNILEDDPRRRWTIDDVETWLAGRRPSPRTAEVEIKPKRAFVMGDLQSHSRRGAAQLLHEHPLKGAAMAEAGELQRWIERGIDNDALSKRAKEVFERAASNAKANGPSTPLQLVARAAILVDPFGPIRFKEIAVMPSGFGNFLATRLTSGGDIQPLIDMLMAKLEVIWTESQIEHRSFHISVEQQLDRARLYIDRKVIGFGVERALYELMSWQTCLSPMIRDQCVITVTQALQALDRIADNMGMQSPVDRHIAAFMVARDRRIHEGLMTTLTAPEGSIKRVIGMLTLLSDAQYRHGPEKLRGLGQWMARLLEPATKRFFEKSMQEQARRDIAAAAAEGDLVKMLSLLDSPDTLANDRAGFEDARMVWQQAELDIQELQEDIDKRQDLERRVGQPLASGLAVVLGMIALGFVIVLAMGGKYF